MNDVFALSFAPGDLVVMGFTLMRLLMMGLRVGPSTGVRCSDQVTERGADSADVGEQTLVFDEPRGRRRLTGKHHEAIGGLLATVDLLRRRADDQGVHLAALQRLEHGLDADDGQTAGSIRVNQIADNGFVRLIVFAPERFQRGGQHLVLGRADIQTHDVDELLSQAFRQLVPEQWHDHVIAGQHDVIDVVGSHDLSEPLDDLLGMMQMDVFDVTLEACLDQPPALLPLVLVFCTSTSSITRPVPNTKIRAALVSTSSAAYRGCPSSSRARG